MKKKILSFIFAICLILSCAVMLYACDNKQLDPIMHTVTFVYGNGTENKTIQIEEGKYLAKPAEPSKTGYTFDGWFIDDFKWGFEYVAVMKDVTLTAKWDKNVYTIDYQLKGGTNDQSNLPSYTVEENLTFAEPSRDGFEFNGWFIDSEFKTQITSTNGHTENLTVYAKWARTNTVTYNLNGSTNNADNPTTFSSDQEVILKDPTIEDDYLTFTGWFTDNEYQNKITTIPAWTETDITLWAKWEDIFKIEDKGEGNEKIEKLTSAGKKLKKIKIPANVATIGIGAFTGSTALEEVVFDANSQVSIIEYYAFENCVKLSSIVLPSRLKLIEGCAFSGCTSLTSITIPSGVWGIGVNTFENCTKLETVIFEDDSELEEFGNYVFKGCSSLTEIIIPEKVEMIGICVFEDCTALDSVTFKDTSTWYKTQSIDDYLYKENGTVENSVEQPSSIAALLKGDLKDYYLYKI